MGANRQQRTNKTCEDLRLHKYMVYNAPWIIIQMKFGLCNK